MAAWASVCRLLFCLHLSLRQAEQTSFFITHRHSPGWGHGSRRWRCAICLPHVSQSLQDVFSCLLLSQEKAQAGTPGGGSPLLRGDLIRQQSRAFSCRVVSSGRFEFTSVLECPCPRVVPQMPVLLFVESSGGVLIIHSSIPRIHMEMPSWAHHAHTCR